MIEINNQTKVKIDKALLKKIAEKFFRAYRLGKKEVSLAFVSDQEMKRWNKLYRRQDKTTDVLSFCGEDDFLGEILISPVQIKKQAKEFKKSFREELIFIFVHGLLHLAGYDDKTEKGRLEMIKRGEGFIKKLNSKS